MHLPIPAPVVTVTKASRIAIHTFMEHFCLLFAADLVLASLFGSSNLNVRATAPSHGQVLRIGLQHF